MYYIVYEVNNYFSILECLMARIGRPPKDTESVTLRVTREMLNQIDDARRVEPDLPTRPEMVRRLLAKALKEADQS